MAGFRAFRRRQQKLAITDQEAPRSEDQARLEIAAEEERVLNDNIFSSVGGLSLATAGALTYTPLGIVSVPITLYACVDIYRSAYDSIFEERQVRASVLDAIAVTGALVARYFVLSALGISIYHVGKKLVAKTRDRSRQNMIDALSPRTHPVWLLVDGTEVETELSKLKVGDVIVISAGEAVPLDGHVVKGSATLDQSAILGEAGPVQKIAGDQVRGSTLVMDGWIHVEIERTEAETVAAQIREILPGTTDFRSSLELKGIEFADRSALPTLGAGAVAYSLLGPGSAVAVVTSNYSEVLRLVAPLGVLNFLDLASREGILVKDGTALERLPKVDALVIDAHALRQDVGETISRIAGRGLSMHIVSSDREEPTRRLAEAVGIASYLSDALPKEKSEFIAGLQSQGMTVCCVGHGITDAAVLRSAQVSISVAGAASVGTDNAQVVLMDRDLRQLEQVFELAQALESNLKSSLVTTFGPGLLCLGGVFFLHFGIFGALVLYNVSLVAGVGNAMLPKLRRPAANKRTEGGSAAAATGRGQPGPVPV